MARLIELNGEYFKEVGDGQFQPLTLAEFTGEVQRQNEAAGAGFSSDMLSGLGKSAGDLWSGAKQLTGMESPQEAQQYRTDLAQAYQPTDEYGSFGAPLGEFIGNAATGFLPGGLLKQLGYGGLQGAAENPESPGSGAAFGTALTYAGDLVGNMVNRIGRTLNSRRMELDEQSAAKVQRAEDAGMEFTPGQRTGNKARVQMEKALAKNPLYAGIDAERYARNQMNLNDLAADTLMVPRTGRVTDEMIGQAYEESKRAFKAFDNFEGDLNFDPQSMLAQFEDLTESGAAFAERFINKHSRVLDGSASPKEYMQARNWLAEQARRTANKTSGISDEIQGFIGVMDEGLEASAARTNPGLYDDVQKARQQWKAMLVTEGAFGGAESAAAGNIQPRSAYNSLKKYYGRDFTQGRARDPFIDAVKGMNAVSDVAPYQAPSGMGIQGGLFDWAKTAVNTPIVEGYMQGNPLSEVLLGMIAGQPADPVMRALGVGAARGAGGGNDDELPPPPGLMQ